MATENDAALPVTSRTALVLGANGQDGSYLIEHLLKRGWCVVGIGRQASPAWVPESTGYKYRSADLSDLSALDAILHEVRPDTVFHFAAVHGAAGFSYEEHWRDVHAVNTISVHVVLEYLRCISPKSTLVYASSSKVFGPSLPEVINESSPRISSCIYTTTKNAATDLIAYYREKHGVFGSVVWTFNHESPRRGENYFIPQIVKILANSILDRNYVGEIGTLGFWADWGDADEFMDIVTELGISSSCKDLILATGNTMWADDFITALFERYGCKRQLNLKEKFAGPSIRPLPWRADVSELLTATRRRPTHTPFDIVENILTHRYPDVWSRIQPCHS